ncbi:sodium-translocating pyrophosphatase [Candidatus Haliotispira prima]|uniref:Putative K(+)-stimulated pyrophosphate-energized sodium pump n=1 Tax=Candidatus Haliotispira prima TaxID=3034016 RepID=A0ABY8MN51_9SPIO|nr:sodium-translocating pyrophosphatase [Candidatus Haliotispira prima]
MSIVQIPMFFWLIPLCALAGIITALMLYKWSARHDEGTSRMKEIAASVRVGAMAYLGQQYRVMSLFFLVIAALFLFAALVSNISLWTPLIFLSGGLFSALAGYFGMKTATMASARTAAAAQKSLNSGLTLAFRSGGVMGLVVVGLGLMMISIWYVVLSGSMQIKDSADLGFLTATILSFGMGASLQALFARVGGGIFTKAADVGGDLVGKIEAGIPEDDPRNPAVIADNVGDNVGDVAGMGADLFESYVGSILAAGTLGVIAYAGLDMQWKATLVPLLIAGLGIVLSIIGIFLVRSRPDAGQKELMGALDRGIYFSTIGTSVGVFLLLYLIGLENWLQISLAVVVGMLVGIIIGKGTEHATSDEYKPTQSLAASAASDPATLVINGIGNGMISTVLPVITVAVGIILSFGIVADWQFNAEGVVSGLYGISIAAVGMLSTLGITLASDAYGPIADNAGGNAEMAGLDKEVRKRTDALDSLGNTTAAIGKGFAIGSAALTALALLASYLQSVRQVLLNDGTTSISLSGGETVDTAQATFDQLLTYFGASFMSPLTLVGFFIGTVVSFFFCGLTMKAVGRAAMLMVNEVRRQFREIPGIMEGTGTPDYANCVTIATKGAQKEMVFPAIIAMLTPIATGWLLGVGAVLGLLIGALCACFTLAIFMANTGGSWDNAKKYIETGEYGGKGSNAHKAAVIGDTIGDPFKDTSGPSLNILIKLMSMVAIATAAIPALYHLL